MSESQDRVLGSVGRRHLLQALVATGAYVVLPSRWDSPKIELGILPAHAELSGGPDAGGWTPPPQTQNDAGSDAAVDSGPKGPPAMCTVGVTKINEIEGRSLYMAYTDVDSNPNAPPACPIYPSTNYMGDIVWAFLGGSPGHSIEGRGDYKILSTSAGTLREGQDAIDVGEDIPVTFSFTQRYPDEDAGPPPIWTITCQMNSDLDPAKWTVSLFSVQKN